MNSLQIQDILALVGARGGGAGPGRGWAKIVSVQNR